ncbi:MAG: site-2 protease family protein, partial [Pyrinomonadaceae bacterium]
MKLFGIPVKVEGSFFVLAFFLASGRLSQPAYMVEWLLVVFVSVLLHEFGHALAGRAFGLAPEITLYSMGGVTSWREGVELSPARHVAVCLAGPGAGFFFGGLVYLARPLFVAAGSPALAQAAFYDLLWANFGWGLFNLLPILPMDGGQALLGVERGVFKRERQLLTPVVSLVAAVAITVWAFSHQFFWAGFLGAWFGVSNGRTLFAWWQMRRERHLHAPLAEAAAAFEQKDFAKAAALAGDVLGRAQSDGLKRQASRLLVLAHALLEDAAAAERELRRHQVFFGGDAYLEGFVRLKTGRAAEAVAHLRAALDSSPTEEIVLALYDALVRSRQFDEALKLCEHTALAGARWPAYVNLQAEAFDAGAYDISARAGRTAFEEQPNPSVAYNVACAYARGGDLESGLVWLERALAAGFDDQEALSSDADLDPLRQSEGFERIRERFAAARSSQD